jgi:hypothetical protein
MKQTKILFPWRKLQEKTHFSHEAYSLVNRNRMIQEETNVCVCIYVYIYMCVCVYVCMYIYG